MKINLTIGLLSLSSFLTRLLQRKQQNYIGGANPGNMKLDIIGGGNLEET
jgi:hypothetical protein